jgi:hypothetical protein
MVTLQEYSVMSVEQRQAYKEHLYSVGGSDAQMELYAIAEFEGQNVTNPTVKNAEQAAQIREVQTHNAQVYQEYQAAQPQPERNIVNAPVLAEPSQPNAEVLVGPTQYWNAPSPSNIGKQSLPSEAAVKLEGKEGYSIQNIRLTEDKQSVAYDLVPKQEPVNSDPFVDYPKSITDFFINLGSGLKKTAINNPSIPALGLGSGSTLTATEHKTIRLTGAVVGVALSPVGAIASVGIAQGFKTGLTAFEGKDIMKSGLTIDEAVENLALGGITTGLGGPVITGAAKEVGIYAPKVSAFGESVFAKGKTVVESGLNRVKPGLANTVNSVINKGSAMFDFSVFDIPESKIGQAVSNKVLSTFKSGVNPNLASYGSFNPERQLLSKGVSKSNVFDIQVPKSKSFVQSAKKGLIDYTPDEQVSIGNKLKMLQETKPKSVSADDFSRASKLGFDSKEVSSKIDRQIAQMNEELAGGDFESKISKVLQEAKADKKFTTGIEDVSGKSKGYLIKQPETSNLDLNVKIPNKVLNADEARFKTDALLKEQGGSKWSYGDYRKVMGEGKTAVKTKVKVDPQLRAIENDLLTDPQLRAIENDLLTVRTVKAPSVVNIKVPKIASFGVASFGVMKSNFKLTPSVNINKSLLSVNQKITEQTRGTNTLTYNSLIQKTTYMPRVNINSGSFSVPNIKIFNDIGVVPDSDKVNTNSKPFAVPDIKIGYTPLSNVKTGYVSLPNIKINSDIGSGVKPRFPLVNPGGGGGGFGGGGKFKGKWRKQNNPIKSYDQVLKSVGIKISKSNKSALSNFDRTTKKLDKIKLSKRFKPSKGRKQRRR